MDKYQKKQANREVRQESKSVIKKWDSDAKNGKNAKLKACPGYVDHSKRRRVELTVPCLTCKRRFCSEECHQTHKPLCEAKFYFAETKDVAPLLELCHKIYDTYLDEDGCVKQVWVDKYELGRNACAGYGSWKLRWIHGDLDEAFHIFKKYDKEFYGELKKKNDNMLF